jgi:hypothetical protein
VGEFSFEATTASSVTWVDNAKKILLSIILLKAGVLSLFNEFSTEKELMQASYSPAKWDIYRYTEGVPFDG